MRIKALRNLGSGFPSIREGEEAEVDDAIGKAIVRANLGVEVEALEKPPDVRTDAPSVTLTTSVVPKEPRILSETKPAPSQASVATELLQRRRRQQS